MTIPRLELNATVLAARLAVQVWQEHDIVFESTPYWSDSTTVLSWINSLHLDQVPYTSSFGL